MNTPEFVDGMPISDGSVATLAANVCRLAELRERRADLLTRLYGCPVPPADWEEFDRLTPFSDVWGMDRGRCIDRYYIERFLAANAGDIRGHVLEVKDPGYANEFGGTAVTRVDVIDIDPNNPSATVVADLRHVHSVPADTYDCIILTQTLHLIFEVEVVLQECCRMLRPSGVLLATLPCASRLEPEQGLDSDFWRFTPNSALALFRQVFPVDAIRLAVEGNLRTNAAFLYALACHELSEPAFQPLDTTPLIISVRAQKRAAGALD